MPRVSWDRAQADLAKIAPAVAEQIERDAEDILHVMPPPCPDGAADADQSDGLMWHRCARHGSIPGRADDAYGGIDEPDNGPHGYFLFYRSEGSDQEFSVVAVRSNQQIASRWAQLNQRLLEFIGTPAP
jgi:hypothetical protein